MIKTSNDMEYKEKKPLLNTLATFGVAAALASSPGNASSEMDLADFYIGWTQGVALQTNYSNMANYGSAQQSTQIGNITTYSQNVILSCIIKEKIIEKIDSMFKYNVNELHESLLEEEDATFTVYTAELDIKNPDYSKLIDEEWEVSEALGLYDKKIILRFL